MYDNYTDNNINSELKREVIQTNIDNVQVSKVTVSLKIEKTKGRRMGVIGIHSGIPYSSTKDSTGNSRPMLNKPMNEVLEDVASVRIALNLVSFLQEYMDEFNVVNTSESLYKVLMSTYRVSQSQANQSIKALVDNDFLRKLSPKKFIVNPYACFRTTLSVYKLYELQMHWEVNKLPMYWQSKAEARTLNQEVINQAKLMVGELQDKLDEQVKEDVPKQNKFNLPTEEYDKLEDIRKDKPTYFSEMLFKFADTKSVQEKAGSNTVVDITMYLSTDKGARHFYNWFKSLHKDDTNLTFEYKNRNKLVKYFMSKEK